MKKLAVLSVLVFSLFFFGKDALANSEKIYLGKILEAEPITEKEGLRMQSVSVEVLEGEYKGNVYDLNVPLETIFVRPISKGDKVKISVTSIEDETYFQFYDFARSSNYLWLPVLFLIVLLVFVGWKGFRTLIPSFSLILLLILGIIPRLLSSTNLFASTLILITLVTALTAWIRIKAKLPTVVITVSVVLSLLIGFLVFMGFSHISYVVPFLGSITTLDEELYLSVLDVVLVSSIIIAFGGVINSSIQTAKHLVEKFKDNTKFYDVMKEGLHISQKISAGELNNLFIIMIGVSFAGIYLIKEQFSEISFWDNGWISLQVIYTISAGISILLISPITTFVTASVLSFVQNKKEVGGQRRLRVVRRRKR